MGAQPPQLPGLHSGETPIDRALTLRLAGETETALRWAAAALVAEPELPSALLLVSELLADLGRKDPAREGLEVCIHRAIEAGLLPLAVAGTVAQKALGVDASKSYNAIADAFSSESPRLAADSHIRPPTPPKQLDMQPLSSLLQGPALLNRAVEVLRASTSMARHAQKSEPPQVKASIPRLPLFGELSRKGLLLLIETFHVRIVPAGGVVIEEGTPGLEAFVVARGELEVRRNVTQSDGKPSSMVLARLQNGQVFGEMAIVSRAPRAASVISTRPSLVLSAPVDQLEQVAANAPDVGEQLAKFCRDRMLQNLIRTSPILRAVAPEERATLVGRFETRTFESGERLISVGDSATGLYLLASGLVEVVAREQGESIVLSTLGPGDVVGEVAMILRRKANADVIAVHPSVMLFLPATGFHEMMRTHPSLLAELYDLAVKRDEETSSVVAQEATSAEDFVLL